MSEIVETKKLRQIVDKIESMEQEKLEFTELLKDAYNEAQSLGFNAKIIKYILKLKKKDKDQLAEEEHLIDLYREALGL